MRKFRGFNRQSGLLKLAGLGSIAGLLLLATGCGGDESDDTETADSSETSQEQEEEFGVGEAIAFAELIEEPEPSGSPVTTIRAGRAGTAIYTGVLGTLAMDQLITPPAGPAPTTFDDRHPLTGLGGEPKQRPAAVVKIDNGPGTMPQAGLEFADVVYEEPVEGGVTRFAAVFQSQGGEVGPVRSGRTTDIGIFGSFGTPMYLYSGANTVTDSLLRKYDEIQNRSFATTSGYYRNSSRRAPSNVYTNLINHWATADGGAPDAHFDFRGADQGADGAPAENFTVSYRANRVVWDWDGSRYLRTQRGTVHTDTNGEQLAVENVVVVGTREVNTGMVDGSGSVVPEYQYVGEGPAAVYTDGQKITGTWTKSTLGSVATFTDDDGNVIRLTPGRTWVQIVGTSSSAL